MTVLVTPAVSAGVALAFSSPAVVTGSTSSVTETSAIMKGSVNPEASATTYQFQWGPNTAYGALSKAHSAGAGRTAINVQATATNLTPGTIYHYRLIAINAAGQGLGKDRTFLTAGHPPPQPVTGGPASISRDAALVTGTVNTQGAPTSWSIQYGLTLSYGFQTFGGNLAAAVAPVGVSATINGLASGTTFHYRLVAAHPGFPPTYGGDQTFTTFPIVAPKPRVRASTTPHRARKKPYYFATTGSITPPAKFPPQISCTYGIISVRYLVGHKTVLLRYTRLQPNCTYSRLVLFRHLIAGHSKRLRVEVHFFGNPYLHATNAPAQRVVLG
jgi:hypothetical protein